jgi:hypothetical protein
VKKGLLDRLHLVKSITHNVKELLLNEAERKLNAEYDHDDAEAFVSEPHEGQSR